jgi:hypothetical protein
MGSLGARLPTLMSGLPARISRNPEELCPPREALIEYARGGRNPLLAGHISRCDRCAWFVTEAMEAEPFPHYADVIDIAPPRRGWLQRLFAWLLKS